MGTKWFASSLGFWGVALPFAVEVLKLTGTNLDPELVQALNSAGMSIFQLGSLIVGMYGRSRATKKLRLKRKAPV